MEENQNLEITKKALYDNFKFKNIHLNYGKNNNLNECQNFNIGLKKLNKILNEKFKNFIFNEFNLELNSNRIVETEEDEQNFFELKLELPIIDTQVVKLISNRLELLSA